MDVDVITHDSILLVPFVSQHPGCVAHGIVHLKWYKGLQGK